MEPGFLQPTRWRAQEQMLVTIVIAAAIAGVIRPIFNATPEHLNQWWGNEFATLHLPFDYYRNILFPRISILLAVYVCYWWANGIIRLLMRNVPPHIPGPGPLRMHIPRGKLLWLLLNAALLIVFLGVVYGLAYSQMAAPAVLAEGMSGDMVIGKGLSVVTSWVIGYFIYATIRELVIRRTQEEPSAHLTLIHVIDKLGAFFLVYFSIGAILTNFDLLLDDHILKVYYFFLIPPVILATYTNFYWVFPLKRDDKLLRGWSDQSRRRLLISTLVWQVPFVFYCIDDSHALLPILFFFWLFQVFVTTPVSWYVFRQRKDKLLRLRGLETALGQSEADLQFLRSQINPHFLFNVLNTLYGTALQEQASRTAAGVQRLGDMMRFMLHENHLAEIPMSKEIEYLRNYIALQELRTEATEFIHIETDIDDNFPEYRIAPMLLIPFVENGFKHGISLREPSWIKLKLHSQGSRILFEIRNSVHVRKGDDPEKARSGIGLKNVLHRLKLLYPNRHEFYMHQDEKEFFVQLSIQP